MGIKQLVVAVNKMDHSTVMYEEARFIDIKKQLDSMLTKLGFNTTSISFVPVSGLEDENVLNIESKM